jgi:protein-S-isoprenylcysteine O-methyltransferase Ste14
VLASKGIALLLAHWPIHFLVGVGILIRYVPQLWRDWRERKRRALVSCSGRVRAGIIITLYVLSIFRAFTVLPGGFDPDLSTLVGLFVFLVGISIGVMALRELGPSFSERLVVFPDSKLVTTGIYGIVRHPLRLGLSLELAGLCIACRDFYLLAFWLLTLIAQIVRSREEDTLLRKAYGPKAVTYQREVPAANFLRGLIKSRRRI